MPTITQVLIVVAALIVIVAAVYARSALRRKVYDRMQRSDKPKSAIQNFLGC